MTRVSNRSKRTFDVVPPAFVVQTSTNQLGDERAPPPRPHAAIEVGNEVIVERYVQTHGRILAHNGRPEPWRLAEVDGQAKPGVARR